jgi:hypothetical protein
LAGGIEEMIFSYDGENYIFFMEYKNKWGNPRKINKQYRKISSYRWKAREIFAEKKSCFFGEHYHFLEVELDTILEIYRFWERYLINRGIRNPKLIGSVIENVDSSYSK